MPALPLVHAGSASRPRGRTSLRGPIVDANVVEASERSAELEPAEAHLSFLAWQPKELGAGPIYFHCSAKLRPKDRRMWMPVRFKPELGRGLSGVHFVVALRYVCPQRHPVCFIVRIVTEEVNRASL